MGPENEVENCARRQTITSSYYAAAEWLDDVALLCLTPDYMAKAASAK